MRIYKSFKEIETDLEYLSLQKEISAVNLELKYELAKESITPSTLVSNLVGSMAKKAIIMKIISKITGR